MKTLGQMWRQKFGSLQCVSDIGHVVWMRPPRKRHMLSSELSQHLKDREWRRLQGGQQWPESLEET